ncbi:hypothetical protein GCM10007416_11940 [Kroppenstedtia guangzhouensis]|uniref:Uncharacterized protein n=2 Tax=Kroppenstedtia guangzhouensis TaxID=1274356 RepID=A0ABQ1GBL7_9BACL|nr:hypothetical protein GCM10007416_11940 [Kroppenstedtia guangzhouensis]
MTLRLGQTGFFPLYTRMVMQILGAPGLHSPASVRALNLFTQTTIQSLGTVLIERGHPEKEAPALACLVFNALLGS